MNTIPCDRVISLDPSRRGVIRRKVTFAIEDSATYCFFRKKEAIEYFEIGNDY